MSTEWFKSTYSGSDKTCVEVRLGSDSVLVRDSKYIGHKAEQPIVTVPASHWPAMLKLALNQESGAVADVLTVTVHDDGGATISGHQTRLDYTVDEWIAFGKGVADGEFDQA